ncbi:MAG: sigma-70 family RNA polymerase sigma factor [Acidimicrobiia bacterium]
MGSTTDQRQRFEEIVGEVFDPLQRFLRRRLQPADADDVLSDVLLVLWRRLDDAPDGQILPWSYGIARRSVANKLRSEQRQTGLVRRLEAEPQMRVEPDVSDAGPDPELTAALNRLGNDDREILRLWAWEQLEPREIAPVLDMSVNAATLRLSRARKKLAKNLSRQDRGSAGHESLKGTRE